jgi:hypothetical protein
MDLKLLEIVALAKDIPEHRLRVGDVGTVVEIYDTRGIEVEFVEASGHTRALLTLAPADVRQVDPDEILAVRSMSSGQ